MATYIVGPIAAGDADGSSWDNRYGTLNDGEDTPVVAGDLVIAGAGVYREQLTGDVAGGAGNPITYIGDVTGRLTDGVGGVVRITGSDLDQTAVRAAGITSTQHYRTFRGFTIDGTTANGIRGSGGASNWIIEDCTVQNTGAEGIESTGDDHTDWTIRRCKIIGIDDDGIRLASDSTKDDSGHLIENCILIGCKGDGIIIERFGDMTIKNCFIMGTTDDGVDVGISPNAAHPVLVYNNILVACDNNALEAAVLGDMTENYNDLFANTTDRTNVAVGANSQTYLPLMAMPLLLDGYRFPPPLLGELSQWSALRRITGTVTPADDLFGFPRPATASKLSWGPIQYQGQFRDADTTFDSSTASLRLDDAGRHHKFVPCDNAPTTVTVQVYREGDYAGNLPQMVVSQPGQADITATATGGVGLWEELSIDFTPAANPPWFVINLISNNTAAAGNYAAYFDQLDVRR